MKKRLVFFVYVDTSYRESKIYDVHFYNLNYFKDSFDCCTFWISLKDFTFENLDFASEIIRKLMSIGFIENTEYKIKKNDHFREALCFYDEVVQRINNGINEVIFFGHTKGLSNNFNDSLLFWISSMYYFGLNFKQDIEDFFYSSKNPYVSLYGFPLMDYFPEALLKYKYMYAGAFYWLNTERVRRIFETYNIKCETLSDRTYAETFPSNHIEPFFCSSYKGKHMKCWDLYNYCRDGIANLFNNDEMFEADTKKFVNYYNNMLINLEIKFN